MGRMPEHAALAHWAKIIEGLRWAAFIVDEDWRLLWTSTELEGFLGRPTEEELGYGRNIVEALTGQAWTRAASPDSQGRMFRDVVPHLVDELSTRGVALRDVVPPEFGPLLDQIETRSFSPAVATSLDYIEPFADTELPVYRVDLLLMTIHDEEDRRIGAMGLCSMGVRPGLVSLLARGDESMYERMAQLIEPGPHQAAILFCDIHGSGDVSRRLPSAMYFKLIRRLWTEIDRTVADNIGIIGKHAGDGASAFFVVEDSGSRSEAAEAAIRAAREIHEVSARTFGEVLETPCLMRIGLHWGPNLYMGQLVPGGRLDVTALGDEVNECARIQECAEKDETLVSKQLMEQLSGDAAARLGLDPEKHSYELVSQLKGVTDKGVRDAGTIPVTRL
ncbi:MAG: adenylate/guanylate cyclase domain-containing protein [Actinomycetota bacterium]